MHILSFKVFLAYVLFMCDQFHMQGQDMLVTCVCSQIRFHMSRFVTQLEKAGRYLKPGLNACMHACMINAKV